MSIMQYFNLDSAPLPLSWAPNWLFFGGAIGGIYDVSRKDTLFIDRGGTIPVVNYGDPVGIIKDLSGNSYHASAPSDAARPIYGREPVTGRRNLLTNTTDVGGSNWSSVQTGSGLVTRLGQVPGPFPGTFASRIRLSSSNDIFRAIIVNRPFGSTAVSTPTQPYNMRTMIRSVNGPGTIRFGFENSGSPGGDFTLESLTQDWKKISRVAPVGVANVLQFFIEIRDTVNSPSTDLVLDIYEPQLERGLMETPYQKVTNTYDASEVGVNDRYYLSFDGVDDVLISGVVAAQKLPFYAGASTYRTNAPDRKSIISLWFNGDNYAGILTSSNNLGSRTIGGLRSTAKGPTTVMLDASKAPINTNECTDTLSIAGFTDVRYNNSSKVQAANNWLPDDVITGNKVQIFDPTLAGRFYRGIVINKEISEVERGLVNQWLKKGYAA